jgi:hypothetical protein
MNFDFQKYIAQTHLEGSLPIAEMQDLLNDDKGSFELMIEYLQWYLGYGEVAEMVQNELKIFLKQIKDKNVQKK